MNTNTPLLGTGAFTAADIDAAFARYGNGPAALGDTIIEECNATGINHDFLACQIADETAWWTSADATERNNPSGFGHTDGAPAGMTFDSIAAGVHASVAHWLTYIVGDDNPLAADDPRFALVPSAHRGVAHTIADIGDGVWATAVDYPQAILNRYQEFLDNGARSDENVNGGSMKVILSAGHLNIADITNEKGVDARALAGQTGSLGTEAEPNEAVVSRAAQLLAAAGVTVLSTDAIYHPEVYADDADLCVFVHHDGVTFGNDHPQKSGAAVVTSGDPTADANDTAQRFVDAWKAASPEITGIADTSTDSIDMDEYYGGLYRTPNTPAAIVECSVWGGRDGERPDVDPDAEGGALAAAIAQTLGVDLGQTIPTDGGSNGPDDSGIISLAGDAFTASALVTTGDGRGVRITDKRTGLSFWVGHGFFDEWIGPGRPDATGLDAAIADDGAPLTSEFTCVHPLLNGGQPTVVQFFERARYEWDAQSGRVNRGRVGAEAMGRYASVIPPGSGHAA